MYLITFSIFEVMQLLCIDSYAVIVCRWTWLWMIFLMPMSMSKECWILIISMDTIVFCIVDKLSIILVCNNLPDSFVYSEFENSLLLLCWTWSKFANLLLLHFFPTVIIVSKLANNDVYFRHVWPHSNFSSKDGFCIDSLWYDK